MEGKKVESLEIEIYVCPPFTFEPFFHPTFVLLFQINLNFKSDEII